ncbi:WD40 repeat-like protein [Amylocystis lapponica]|nr:WD40 repeat-like protein [Amylocystis lapponica]
MGMLGSGSVTLPLTFVTSQGNSTRKSPVELSCSLASPSCLVSWDCHPIPSSETPNSDEIFPAKGIALGCKDGTVYILQSAPVPLAHSQRRSSDSCAVPPEVACNSRPTSPLRYSALGLSAPRSASISSARSSFSPFHITQSRIVSAVSKEQVEAPKNYVDFDDEQDKLKGMLKGKGIKDKLPADSLSPNVDRGYAAEKAASSPADSLRARTLSPPSSAVSLSLPPSPTAWSVDASQIPPGEAPLFLKCHVFPPRFGPTHGIVAMKALADGRHIICLQETGDITIFATSDGSCIASISIDDYIAGSKDTTTAPAIWLWRTLSLTSCGETSILLACATPDEIYSTSQPLDVSDGDPEDQTRVVAFTLSVASAQTPNDTLLEKVGDWYVDGPVQAVGLHEQTDGSLVLSHISSSHRLTIQTVDLSRLSAPENDVSESNSPSTLPIPNPFKALTARSKEHLPDTNEASQLPHLLLGQELDIGSIPVDGPILGMRCISGGASVNAIIWSTSVLSVFQWRDRALKNLFTYTLSEIRDVQWVDEYAFIVVLPDRAESYSIVRVDANNDNLPVKHIGEDEHLMQPNLVQSASLLPSDACCVVHGERVVSTRVKNGRRRIESTSLDIRGERIRRAHTLWAGPENWPAGDAAPRLSCLLPVELYLVIQGYSDGSLRRSSLTQMIGRHGDSPRVSSDVCLSGIITGLHVVDDERTKERFIIGGADDGSIAIWALETLKLCVRWTIFTTPLVQVIQLREEGVGRLRGCILCISHDGTIAVVTLDDFQFLFLVPASAAALKKVCLGTDNLLLMYADGRARLWDTKTREFWRSMNIDKAEELLKQGGWSEWLVGATASSSTSTLSTLFDLASVDSASTLLLDVEALLQQNSPGSLPSDPRASATTPEQDHILMLEVLRSILSALLTFGLDNAVDDLCRTKLGVDASSVLSGLSSQGSTSLFAEQTPSSPWSISPVVSAARAIALVAVLQKLTHHEDLAQDAVTVTAYYAASLPQAVGPLYQFPNLPVLAEQWLRTSVAEVRHAARMLFDSGVSWLSDKETMLIVETWQPFLPYLQADADRESTRSAMALFICGFIAVEKYNLLPTSALTDVARSIAIYLHNEASLHRALAIDLCSRGFPVWQQYVDAVDMLRALFTLATTSRKEAISVHNIGTQARTAVLQIASSNTPLFMTTMTIDILHPQSVQHRRSILQLVIFLIRKKPLVLYSNLPRLVEAVVKSLDPNSTASRDAVLDSATEILGHVVRTFPTVDFHMPTQRLAVGTSEGAVVMYDLKTATRLYVLEGHKKRTTACSFSPDGRRLVTVSLEESVVLVWKVGSSFTSLFNPGAPPRQGHGGSDPFKTLSFNVGDEAHMTLAATLDYVRFEWPAERSVRLKIRDSILTFST